MSSTRPVPLPTDDDLPVPTKMTANGKAKTSGKTLPEDEPSVPVPSDLPLPPDGGWGWVVVLASFLANVIVDGVCFTFGVFYIEFLDYFGESRAKTALVGALVPGMYLSLGPIVSSLANKYGCRPVTMAGGVMSAICFFLCTFAPNVDWMIVLYGILGGAGFGLMYLPSIVIVGFYFDKKRALATGLAVCGTGIGTLIFAPFASYLIRTYSWTGAMWIISGICLHGIACGAIYRPLPPPRPARDDNPDPEQDQYIMKTIIAEKNRRRSISTKSLDGVIITHDNELVKDPHHDASSNKSCPESLHQDEVRSDDDEEEEEEEEHIHSEDESLIQDKKDYLQPNGHHPSLEVRTPSMHSTASSGAPVSLVNKNLARVQGLEPGGGQKVSRAQSSDQVWERPHGTSESSQATHSSTRSLSAQQQKEAANRPMYRKDIFYTGSVTSIPQYKSNPNMASYVNSVTSLPVMPVGTEDTSCKARCAPLTSVMKDMFDFSMLKSITFIILCTASVLAMIGFFTPFIYVTDQAISLGVDTGRATMLISVLGICNTLGRVISGFISDRPWADCVVIHNVALIIAGAATCVVPWLGEYAMLVVYCCCFGFCIAAFIALRSIVLVELLGLEKLTSSFGILLLFQGVASMIGSPLAGFIRDATDSYTISFISSGILIAVAGLICLPVRRVAEWERSRSPVPEGPEVVYIVTAPDDKPAA